MIFYVVIKALNIKTPGREDEEVTDGEKETIETPAGGNKYETMAAHFIQDIGGKENITNIDNCATRLRLMVKDTDKVNDSALKSHGAKGVMKLNKTSLQIIVDTDVEFVADAMKKMDTQSDDTPLAQEEMSEAPKILPIREQDFVMPIEGEIIPITEVQDPVFSQKMMGDGFAIIPAKGSVVSPVDGEILNIFPTKHAIGIKSKQGYEILIHIGLETVHLKGEGFTVLVKDGEQVQKGQELIQFDLEKIKNSARSTETPVVFTNLTKLTIKKQGKAAQGENGVITIE